MAWGWLGKILAGGAILGGSLGSSAMANKSAKSQRTFEASEAQKNRDFQERMSNTAYQRSVADMKSAGINPILAAQSGGASGISGAQASGAGAASIESSGIHALSNIAMLGLLSSMDRKRLSQVESIVSAQSGAKYSATRYSYK